MDIIFTGICLCVVFCMLWFVKGRLLMPVRLGCSQEITAVLRVTGSAPELENAVNAIEWLRLNGTLSAGIVIVDAGMDNDTRQTALLLAKRDLVEFQEVEFGRRSYADKR